MRAAGRSTGRRFLTTIHHGTAQVLAGFVGAGAEAAISMTDDPMFERLRALGWTAFQAEQFQPVIADGRRPARVITVHRGVHVVDDGTGARRARVSGRLRFATQHASDFPVVGDWVVLHAAPNADTTAVVHSILPRQSALLRKSPGRASYAQALAANVDLVLLTAALQSDVNVRRLERAIALVWESGALPLVLLTKADLCGDVEAALASARARLTGIDVIALSTHTGVGVHECAQLLRPTQTAVLLGASGVGKSTLLNALLEEPEMRTAAVRPDGKGRHTTTHRQLFRLPNGALVIDTPGLRELALWGGGDDASLDATFDDVAALAAQCRFADCAHESEPGCAVLEALLQGQLDGERLAHWRQLRAELAYLSRRDDQRQRSEAKRRDAAGARAARARMRDKYR